MSTRKANFVTVDELLDVVGVDVARFFFMMRKADSQLEFDLGLATKAEPGKPGLLCAVRACPALFDPAPGRGQKGSPARIFAEVDPSLLSEPEELKLLKSLVVFPGDSSRARPSSLPRIGSSFF